MPTFKKLIKLSTTWLAQLMLEVDHIAPEEVQGKEREISGTCTSILEENFLDPVYDFKAKLAFEVW